MALQITQTPDPTTGATGATSATRTVKKELGKDDFLLLLTKQLQNQDPLEPTNNTEFVAQMANFSSLEQMSNMNTSLTKFLATAGDQYRIQAMSMLGRNVTATVTDVPEPITGQVTKVCFSTDGEAVFTVDDYTVKMSEITDVNAS
jgi:flagellar basal-body rod modification protein FlgD